MEKEPVYENIFNLDRSISKVRTANCYSDLDSDAFGVFHIYIVLCYIIIKSSGIIDLLFKENEHDPRKVLVCVNAFERKRTLL